MCLYRSIEVWKKVSLIPIYCIASVCLYVVLVTARLGPYVLSVLFLVPSLALTFLLAWLLRRPDSTGIKGRTLSATLPVSLVAVLLGAILVAVALFGPHGVRLIFS